MIDQVIPPSLLTGKLEKLKKRYLKKYPTDGVKELTT